MSNQRKQRDLERRKSKFASMHRKFAVHRLSIFVGFCSIALGLGLVLFFGLAQLDPQQQQHQQSQQANIDDNTTGERVNSRVLPPPKQRPIARVDIGNWAQQISKQIHIVNSKTGCLHSIASFYDEKSEIETRDLARLRHKTLSQIDLLLKQHRAAVNEIVTEAERLAAAHTFSKNLTVNYTDVHRLRNEFEYNKMLEQLKKEDTSLNAANASQAELLASLYANWGISTAGGAGDKGSNLQPTSINGGAPVVGPPEWQTPIRTIVMQVNKNFGDIPVNTSMSAVHLPLPIYAGLPRIMNTIAWTEGLDAVFKRNLAKYAHVHHQYYGDQLGPMRTFPAHKWRIPRLEPDLFDARLRPWYSAGIATPTDMIILVDTSGSMTGLRREIARGVVFEILDTLSLDDNFAVLRFSESVTPVGVPRCQVRRPKLALDLHDYCLQASDRGSLLQSRSLPADRESECLAYRRQWLQQGQYLREHPDMVPGINATVITDDAYFNSIANITNDIRDAYFLPATSRNIRYVKTNFTMPTAGIANFTHALMAAFELMNAYNRTKDLGSQCNKAIMLITDGAIRSHEEVFNRYNYPGSPVRIFTYMIGREVGDIKPTKAMACNNRGYYTNVINLSEIREQVLKYPPVFARPAILTNHHPVTWTNAYGDETYQVLTDWVLEVKRRERARIILNEERDRILAEANSSETITEVEYSGIAEYDELPLVNEELRKRIICENSDEDPTELDQSLQEEIDPLGYNELACHWAHSRRADLLTSVVKPVYDLRNTSIAFQRVLSKNVWTEKEIRLRDARLLGVGAVDLRIDDIMTLAPSHQLGVNAYPILIGQYGFLLHHQDLRALLEDPFDKQSKLLKPYFNAVELPQVEQVLHLNETKRVMHLRDQILRHYSGNITVHGLKRSLDCRRRPHIRNQVFYYAPVQDTPFSLALAIPLSYGNIKVNGELELSSKIAGYLEPLDDPKAVNSEYWTLHPGYRYCEGGPLREFSNDSTVAINYLLRQTNLWNSINYGDLTLLDKSDTKKEKVTSITCDQELFKSLLFDAAATSESRFAQSCSNQPDGSNWGQDAECESNFFGRKPEVCNLSPEAIREKTGRDYGLELSFIATRSGLTRVRMFDSDPRVKKLAELFLKRHNRAIEEPWYSRTVDFNMKNHESVMVTVPFNAYTRLVAKMRQRITQRHPAVNQTRANCDFSMDAAYNDSLASTSPDNSQSVSSQDDSSTRSLSTPNADETESPSSLSERPQADEPQKTDSDAAAAAENLDQISKIDYNEYTSYEILDLVANSSVHVSITQTIIAHRRAHKRGSPVGVNGLLLDYATFARHFLNATSLTIHVEPSSDNVAKVDLCPNGACATKCGYRNDSIDCLLVDTNTFIVVGEELAHIGRSLAEYDDRLLASLIGAKIFQPIRITDYQAICSRADQQNSDQQARSGPPMGSSSAISQSAGESTRMSHPFSSALNFNLQLASGLLSNFASSVTLIASAFYSLLMYQSVDWNELGDFMQLSRSVVDAQLTSSVNLSILASLPNKTYLRPCERMVTVYEANREMNGSEVPEYYESRCGCPAWYVYEYVPKTNLIMLIVNTTSECRRNCSSDPGPTPLAPIPGSPLPGDQQIVRDQMMAIQANLTAEEQVCSMLEQADAQQIPALKRYDLGTCMTGHPSESQIKICGSANRAQISIILLVLLCIATATATATATVTSTTSFINSNDIHFRRKRHKLHAQQSKKTRLDKPI